MAKFLIKREIVDECNMIKLLKKTLYDITYINILSLFYSEKEYSEKSVYST